MAYLILAIVLILSMTVGFICGSVFGIAGMLISVPIGGLLGYYGAKLAIDCL